MAFIGSISAEGVLFCRTKENQKGRRCPEGMKAPVGLSSRRAVCDSRWKDFVLTSVGAAPNTNIKINFPLNMARAQAETILIVYGKDNPMQNIDLICVGKLNAKYFAEGVAEYQKRLAAFASFRIIELPEEKIEEKNASDAVVKKALEKEGKAILSSVRKGAAIVAMCIEGKQISSDELAQFLADRANSGAGDVAFVIGSSHGLAEEVKRAAALKFSMGRITMPHQLARLVLTEQIYRACTINAGMKYHK